MPIRHEFAVHRLNAGGMKKAEALATSFSVLLEGIEAFVGPGQSPCELAIVRTKLQEACFFAKRAIAVDPANQESA